MGGSKIKGLYIGLHCLYPPLLSGAIRFTGYCCPTDREEGYLPITWSAMNPSSHPILVEGRGIIFASILNAPPL